MNENPYHAPNPQTAGYETANNDSNSSRGKTLDMLVSFLMIACLLWFGMLVIGRFMEGPNAPPLYRMIGFYLMIGIAPFLGILGAASTLERKRYPLALVGAVCMSVPVFGPWCGFTMPFGIWAVVLLLDPTIKESFETDTVGGIANESELSDDVLAHAARLDQNGDWEQAIEIFRDAAKRWPEHAEYAQNCIREIRSKIES